MVISHKYKILFIHIPKTGGTFIFDVLKSVDEDLEIIWDDRYSNIEYTHHAIPSEELIKKYEDNGYYVFCFIRNPYDLIISFYL